jgi:hypothetical protein
VNVEEEVKSIFSFRPITSKNNLYVLEHIQSKESVSMHVRRGDYVNNPILGGLVDVDYYMRAIACIKERTENPHFFVFSDDMKWVCNNILQHVDNICTIIDWNKKENSYLDMQLMSKCKHHIIPNSSFSWWGAYLADNKNKIVVTPRTWTNKERGIEMRDMNLTNWVVMDNH